MGPSSALVDKLVYPHTRLDLRSEPSQQSCQQFYKFSGVGLLEASASFHTSRAYIDLNLL